MRFDATFPLQSAIRRNSGGFASALVLILAALLVAAHPARAAGPQAQPAAKQPRNARPVANQTAPPNAAATPNAVPEQSAAQTAAPIAEPVLRQNLVQDPFRVAIDQAVQKGKQEAATKPATTPATPIAPGNAAPSTSPNATTNAPQNTSPNASPNTNATSSGPPAVNGATNPNQPAAARLVCQGTRPATGAAYTLMFDPNANPAPAAGDACIPTGQPKAVGQAVMSSAPKTGPALAVVVPSTPTGGGNTSAAGSASERLVCQGTRPATGAAYTLLFDPNANPAPAAGDACIPTGQKMAKGTAVMSSQKTTGPALAVVFVPPSTAGGGNTSAAGSASARLVCQGTRPATGAAFTLLFDPNASPAPAAGDACIPSGQKMAKGTAVMSSQKTTGPALAVVFVPPTKAGGANTGAAGPAAATLVCKGTRVNGAAFTFPFAANTSPAPAPGDACVPSGKKMPKGTAVMGTAPKAAKVFAVVFVPPTSHNTK